MREGESSMALYILFMTYSNSINSDKEFLYIEKPKEEAV